MQNPILLTIVAFGCTAAMSAPLLAQGKVKPLTALDYLEIQQLNYRYAFALDNCSNHGEDYANLYTDDGVFVVGLNGLEYKGHQKLVEAAGGPTCARVQQPHQTHTTENLVIEASTEGATGKSYLVYPGDQGKRGDADFDGHVGGYQDVYVRTPKGWRIKSRVHVFPPQIPGEYKGVPNTKLDAGSSK
jgi:ketosteroid isomerase-like protein